MQLSWSRSAPVCIAIKTGLLRSSEETLGAGFELLDLKTVGDIGLRQLTVDKRIDFWTIRRLGPIAAERVEGFSAQERECRLKGARENGRETKMVLMLADTKPTKAPGADDPIVLLSYAPSVCD
jgi:hypothetical protein